LNWAPCILKKIQQDQYKLFDQHETLNVSKVLFWDGNEGLCNLWSTFLKYPTKKFLKAFRFQIADGSNDRENSINSSNDGEDDSQPLIGVNSFNPDDQINTGAGHDISHNKDTRPSVEDDKSSSSDQSSNDSESDNDDVGATPSRGKNANSLLNLQQRILPTAMNRGVKTPKVAPQYKSSSELDSDNDDVGAQPPRGKNGKSLLNQPQRIVPTVQNLGGKTPRVPPQYKYHSVFQTFPYHLLAKDLYNLKAIIEEITNSSFSHHPKATPQSILHSKVESWNMRKVANTVSSSIFDDNIGEDGLSAQSMYEKKLTTPITKMPCVLIINYCMKSCHPILV
jgi:hypothetical protein